MNIGSRTAAALLVSAVLFPSCGGKEQTPVAPPSTAPPTTIPPVTIPTPLPPPGFSSCSRIGLGSSQQRCARENPSFDRQVEQSIDELMREKPQLFSNVPGGIRVNSTGQFLV